MSVKTIKTNKGYLSLNLGDFKDIDEIPNPFGKDCDVDKCEERATKNYGNERFCDFHYNETIECHKRNKVGDFDE